MSAPGAALAHHETDAPPEAEPIPFGVYIHFPYCLSKCHYCDFASRAEAVIPQRRYTDAILRELRVQASRFLGGASDNEAASARASRRRAVSVYFGGGTPSLWDPPLFKEVLDDARALFRVEPDAEITLEANPGTTDEARFSAFRAAGANRISIGVQSFAPRQLVSLGRQHSGGDAVRAFQVARAAGFDNISLDLIHGAEEQDPAGAARDARTAIELGPEHLSCYALTLTGLAEEVPMAKALRRGEFELPDDEVQSEMGDAVRRELESAGYRRYEISNFARPGREAVHNTLYWRGLEYAAVGCGACGFIRDTGPAVADAPSATSASLPERSVGRRWQNDRSPERYLARVEESGIGELSGESLTLEDHLRERLFTGLRLADGLDLAALERELETPIRARFASEIERLCREGLAELQGARFRLTPRGLDLHSEAALRFF